MRRVVCPLCGYSDFLRYDYDEYWHCMCCGMEYSESEFLNFEKEIHEMENGDYGATIINTYQGGFDRIGMCQSDGYYDELADSLDTILESIEEQSNKDIGNKGWEDVDGSSLFDKYNEEYDQQQ